MYTYKTNSLSKDDNTGSGFVLNESGRIIISVNDTEGKLFLKRAVRLLNQKEKSLKMNKRYSILNYSKSYKCPMKSNCVDKLGNGKCNRNIVDLRYPKHCLDKRREGFVKHE